MPPKPQLEFNWCAPVSGDGFYLGLPTWERSPEFEYIVQIFRTAEKFGFKQLLIGMGFTHHTLEAWTLATAVLTQTNYASAMVAVRPGFISAPVLAKMAVTLDHISRGRLSLNIVTGGRPTEQAMYGDYLDHDGRYRRTREFMQICRQLWLNNIAFDFDGEFYQLQGSKLETLPLQPGGPTFYFGGASDMAQQVGAELSDVYLMWAETFEQIEARIHKMRLLVKACGREKLVRYGVRVNIITRSTEIEAREAAREMISKVNPDILTKARATEYPNTKRESVGQGRQWELRANSTDEWYIEPHLWAGISIVRSGAGMTIVGSYKQVAEYVVKYINLGITVFILSGYPHLEECENVGRNVLPLVREKYLKFI
ncbi:alkanesulfonate monooxygenase [Dulcicalothrix desertica PCC 7102]|uniref:Alkanesulfonate monooxygenase n=1 Tax=Dulcicalothrix desertica PCC 7102 TaxID=232991 RepID=A0A433V6N6_9CYAN|nr:LLM class flavin-dependent oxidoreductase [Dulcicalothrix desertica]RUT01756.1 alkanesulfonate monooxygenase [Dulcicalothrix desertica PCC 7102]TWH42907.1 alkanesulfonate monooxygenase [Dulcicalothrix desertica PCC 7102]